MQTLEKPALLEFTQHHKARKNMYQFFHLLFFTPITKELFQEIKSQGYLQGLKETGEGGVLLSQYFNSGDLENAVEIGREDYFKLFIGPDALKAPPWESVYRGKERCLFDFPTFEVRELYNQFGLVIEKKQAQHAEADDHLIFELEFMLNLIERTLQETERKKLYELLNGQRTMLEKHLLLWIPQFSQDVQEHASSELYKGLAKMFHEFIIEDCQLIDEMLNAVLVEK